MGYLVEEVPKPQPVFESVNEENEKSQVKNGEINGGDVKPLPQSPAAVSDNNDPYPLGRSHLSSSRLNLSHFLWRQVLGFNIHPRIPTAGFKRIVDIATGTAIWPLDVASEYPDSAVDGYDISLKQCPPRDFLPRIRKLGEWDIFEEPPEEMCGRYDIVHVRLVIFVVQNNDPRSIIRNLMKLLKPGGWLQWDELDLSGSHLELGSSPTKSSFPPDIFDTAPTASSALKRVQGISVNHWSANLPTILAEEGMVQADKDVYIIPPPWAKTFSDCHLMMEEEMMMGMPAEMRMNKGREIGMIAEESRKGAVISTPLMVTIARKPFSQS
jgi:SAM-dependent methyltransferase